MITWRQFLLGITAGLLLGSPSSCVMAQRDDPSAVVKQCAVDLQGQDLTRENAAFEQLSTIVKSHPSEVNYTPVVAPLMSYIGGGGLGEKEAYASADLLEKIGLPAVPALLQGLTSPEARLRWACAQILVTIHPVESSIVPALIPLVNDRDSYVRRVAIESLGTLGPQARPAVPTLIQALHSLDQSALDSQPPVPDSRENGYDRIDCHVALIHILGVSQPHVTAIASLLEDRNPDVRAPAASMLGELGAMAKSASPQLQRSLQDSSAQVRIDAAHALGQIGDASPAVVAALINVLQTDQEIYARQAAAGSLGDMGPKAKAAIPALTAVIDQKDDHGGWWVAVQALGKIGGHEVIPGLTKALNSPDDEIRQVAVEQLGNLGSLSRSVLPALRERLQDKQPYIRQDASEAITKIEHSRRL